MRETPPKPPAPQQRWLLWLASHAAATDAPRSWLSRYGVALGAVGVATVVRRLLDPLLADNAPYGVYLLAVLFVVWRAGLGPAVFTIFTGTLLGRYFFDAPRFTLWITTESNEAGYLMSVTIGFAAVVVSESLRVAAREYRRLFELARQSDARKDEFLATLAHELRNPLMPIRNATYLLGEIEPQNAEVARLQHTIERHTKHLIRLVNDLLDLSRITQRKIDLRRERVDLQSIFDDAVEAARPLMDEKRQEFHCSLPAGNITLEGDAVRLTQVVTNLLHNAAKYTGHEGRVWLSAELENGQAVIRVRDTGIGIPTDLCERIFGLFEQAHEGIENSQGGLGIGLTLVRELVERHGGTVEAHSPGPGLGSEFIVRLPGAESAPGVAPPALSPLPRGVAAGRALRIMIVDDSPAIVATLDMILRDWKHIVQICNDGFAALEAARSFQPDVVLADLGMPRMNGYDLARALRRMPALRDCILIAISGYGQQADMQRSREAGFVRHLVKPVELETLKAILGTLGGPFPDSGAQPQLSR
jgi:signal transduction histidine kinase/ActR/RegA family two-component response regulator